MLVVRQGDRVAALDLGFAIFQVGLKPCVPGQLSNRNERYVPFLVDGMCEAVLVFRAACGTTPARLLRAWMFIVASTLARRKVRHMRRWTLTLAGTMVLGCGADFGSSVGSAEAVAGARAQAAPRDPAAVAATPPMGNTNIGLGGSQDFGFYRQQVEAGEIPTVESLDAAGFFAEHHSELPEPSCGERICVQPMVAVMGNLLDGNNCTMLHLGLNSPMVADPKQRPPLSLAVVIDVSGSMNGEKIDFVKQGLEVLIDGMRDEDEVAFVSYSDAAQVVAPLDPVESRRVELRNLVRGLNASGGTNLADGLEAGYRELLSHYDSSRQQRVILLSDGQPTVGVTQPDLIIEASRGYNSDGIGLTTVGLGSDFNVELMRDLALQADGNFYFLENTAAVNEVFEEELSFFTVPVAFDLELAVTAGDDYSFGRALGTPFWQDTSRGGKLSVPSVFLAHREADDDVTEEGGRRGGGSALLLELMPTSSEDGDGETTIAALDFTFREPGTDTIVEEHIDVTYPFAPASLQRKGYFEADDVATVQKSFVMLNIYVGMERVSTDFHAGRASEETTLMLDGLIAAVQDYNDEIGDMDIAMDLQLLLQLRANLTAHGIGAFEPEPVADAWPAD